MSSLQERIIESIESDLKNIKEFEEGKTLRKECSLLTKRVESAKKLCSEDSELTIRLVQIERDISELL